MNNTPVIGLIHNIVLLLSLALLLDFIEPHWKIGKIYVKQIPAGIFIGLLGIASAITPWQISNEIIYDTCSILFSISGLFFGLIPTLIGMIFPVIYHAFLGEHIFIAGIINILVAGSIGLVWRHLLKKPLIKLNWYNLLLFGFISHFFTLVSVILLSYKQTLNDLHEITFIPSLIFPTGTMLLGVFFVNRLKRENLRQTLQDREEQLQLAVDAAKIGFFNRDLINNQVFLSEPWKKQLGYDQEEIKHDIEEWISRLHPDDREQTLKNLDQFIKNKQNNYELEYRVLHKDGYYLWILERGTFETDAQGKAIKLLGCNIDITNRKHAEDLIRESKQQFESLTENILDGIMLFDENYRLVYINPTGIRMTKKTKEDLIQKNIQEGLISAAFSDFLIKNIPLIFKHGQTTQRIFTEQNMLLSLKLSLIKGDQSSPKMVLCIVHDLTEVNKAKTAYKESEAKFRQIFETAGIGISITDLNGQLIDGNQTILDMLGYTLEEYTQLTLRDITHPDDQAKNQEILDNYRNGTQDSFVFEKRNFHKDGRVVWGQLTSTVVRDSENRPLFTIGMFEDITERKRAQAEMKRLLETTDQSRKVLLSLVEDQQIAQASLTKLTQDLISAYDSTLQGWSNALELKEQETAGHSKRVVQLTMDLAKQFNVPEEDLIHIERGALLHDIGKMGIPDSILLKPGQLSEDEWVTMRRHPEYAYELLNKIEYLRPSLDIPYCHHERWDGTGYPRGLKGEEIPLPARIFAVIDVWDALLSNRSYRPAWPEHEVINYLKKYAGIQFDPKVVEAFLEKIFSEKTGRL